jgi:hypothetical protein
MKLREIAHSRTGDKGDISNISLVAFKPEYYPLLEEYVTPEHVRQHFADIVHGQVTRYALPSLGTLNFVMERALGGGVTRTLALDAHGKCLSSLLMALDIPELDGMCKPAAGDAAGDA